MLAFPESQLFFELNGQFGITDVIGYHDYGTGDPHRSTTRLLNGAEFWRVFGQQDLPEGRPEERGLQCIAFSGEGKALIDPTITRMEVLHLQANFWRPSSLLLSASSVPSAPHLLLMFADLGHINLFYKGILHWDISSRNILCYSEPIKRPALDQYGSSYISFINLVLIYSLGLSAQEMCITVRDFGLMGIMQLSGVNSPALHQTWYVAGIALSLKSTRTYVRARCP